MLQKSKVAPVQIFGETLKREAIDDSNNLSRATEVAYEVCVRRRGPSDPYTKTASAALRIFDTFGKTTFATLSANCRHKSSSCPPNHRTRPSEQSHRELGAIAKFAVDRDGAAVLLRYDFVADRQPKPRALAGRLQSIFFGGMPMRLSRTLGPRRRRRTRGW
jgi:hypothetical protein